MRTTNQMYRLIPLLALIFCSLPVYSETAPATTYYKNINAQIEFRIVVNDADTHSILLPSLQGPKVNVSDVIFGPKDVTAVEITNNQIVIHFNPSSWSKVKSTTKNFATHQLAIIKDGVVLSTPRIDESIDRAAALKQSNIDLKKFLLGFVKSEKPSEKTENERYRKFLEGEVAKSPDDRESLQYLVYGYFHVEPRQYAAAVPFLKRLIAQKSPLKNSVELLVS